EVVEGVGDVVPDVLGPPVARLLLPPRSHRGHHHAVPRQHVPMVSRLEDMRYRTLGHSGLAVSELCLGTMTFGDETDEAASHAQLDRFLEAGGTFVDT